ncbi:MAG: hypothetical protein ACK5NT_06535, partial [Pyrinomonadaceae bacterium]
NVFADDRATAENKQKEVRNASNVIIGQYFLDGEQRRAAPTKQTRQESYSIRNTCVCLQRRRKVDVGILDADAKRLARYSIFDNPNDRLRTSESALKLSTWQKRDR